MQKKVKVMIKTWDAPTPILESDIGAKQGTDTVQDIGMIYSTNICLAHNVFKTQVSPTSNEHGHARTQLKNLKSKNICELLFQLNIINGKPVEM